jgi:hypothetical protein
MCAYIHIHIHINININMNPTQMLEADRDRSRDERLRIEAILESFHEQVSMYQSTSVLKIVFVSFLR